MPGMKEGAGEDPFVEDEDEPEDDTATPDATTSASDSSGEQTNGDSQQSGQQQSLQIPYKLRRDGVQDGRDRVPLFLQPDTKRDERHARRELEDRFDGNVPLTDLREALVKAGLEHLDDVEAQLEAWGYGMTFNE